MAIFRGTGGSGDSTQDATLNEVTQQAVNAAGSAAAASSSASDSSTSAGQSSTSATNAANSATASANSATASSNSKDTSTSQATIATTKASEASTSATNAAASASTASTQATNSASSATASANSATASANSATAAAASASTATTKASEAATSATNAATSNTNSGNSATASANSATAAASSASGASTSASTATTKASEASTSASNAASSLASFTGQYVAQSGAPSSPSTGDLWFDTSASIMKVYNGSGWVSAGSSVSGTSNSVQYTATSNQTSFNATYDAGYLQVYLNGIRLDAEDYTATNGSTVVLDTGATVNDVVFINSFGTFQLADHYSKTQADVLLAAKLALGGGTMTGDTAHGDNVKAKFGTGNDLQIYHDGSASRIVDSGTGGLTLQADANVVIQNSAGTETKAEFTTDGGVNLYHDNVKRLETTATGVGITGAATFSDNATGSAKITGVSGDQTDRNTGGYPQFTFVGNEGTGMRRPSVNQLAFDTSGDEAMRINPSGNVGIGVVPEAGWSSYSALQIGGTGSLFSSTAAVGGSATQFANNAYRDGSGNYKHIITDEASRTYQESGSHVFQVAPSGTADAAISWTTAMTIANAGIVTKPLQPAFFAYRSGSNYSTSSGNEKVLLDGYDYDINSDYNTSTARFNAPVAGRYFFTGSINCYSMSNDSYNMATLKVNGVIKAYGNRSAARNGGDWNVSVSAVLNMAAGDYVELWSFSADASRTFSAGAWNHFSGHLIG